MVGHNTCTGEALIYFRKSGLPCALRNAVSACSTHPVFRTAGPQSSCGQQVPAATSSRTPQHRIPSMATIPPIRLHHIKVNPIIDYVCIFLLVEINFKSRPSVGNIGSVRTSCVGFGSFETWACQASRVQTTMFESTQCCLRTDFVLNSFQIFGKYIHNL